MVMTMRSLCTAGIALASLAIFTEGTAVVRSVPLPWVALGTVAGLAWVLRIPRRE
jgi:hypothetical protein